MGTFLGVPIIRTIVFWGLYWGPLILGNYQVALSEPSAEIFVGRTVCRIFFPQQPSEKNWVAKAGSGISSAIMWAAIGSSFFTCTYSAGGVAAGS